MPLAMAAVHSPMAAYCISDVQRVEQRLAVSRIVIGKHLAESNRVESDKPKNGS
jgi:hypothetical protein